MLPIERAFEYSEADALEIDALFRRIAERGHKIRAQKQALNLDFVEKSGDAEAVSPEAAVTSDDGQTC